MVNYWLTYNILTRHGAAAAPATSAPTVATALYHCCRFSQLLLPLLPAAAAAFCCWTICCFTTICCYCSFPACCYFTTTLAMDIRYPFWCWTCNSQELKGCFLIIGAHSVRILSSTVFHNTQFERHDLFCFPSAQFYSLMHGCMQIKIVHQIDRIHLMI